MAGGGWQVTPSPLPGALRPRPRRFGDMIEWHWLHVEEWQGLTCHSFVSPAPFVPPLTICRFTFSAKFARVTLPLA